MELVDFGRARIIGVEIVARDGPAGMGHPVALFEIFLFERTAPAAPMVRAAAEIAQARTVQRVVHAADLALVKRLGVGVEVEAAGFDQRDPHARPCEFARNGNARSPAANDGEVGLDNGSLGNLASIDKHIFQSSGWWPISSVPT